MAKKEAAPAVDKKRGVGDAAIQAIKSGLTNDEALSAVKKEFPDSRASVSSINWYRNKLRSDNVKADNGKPVKTSRELTKEKKAAADPLA